MSDEDVERLRAFLETLTLDDVLAGRFDPSLVDPDCIYEDRVLPDHAGETFRGYAGMAHAAETWLAPFETFSADFERVVSVGADHAYSVARFRGKFRHTGLEYDVPVCWLYTLRDGRITRWRAFVSEDEALAAAREESNS